MAKYAKDPELNTLANELKSVVWLNPLNASELDHVRHLATVPHAKRRLVVPLPNFISWGVRLYLGGEQRTLGLVNTANVDSAFRFADMAQQYFWKYRVRGACPPVERDLNFSLARLYADMEKETNALGILQRTERYFLDSGILKSSETRQGEAKVKRDARVTVAGQARGLHQEVMEMLDGVLRGLDKVSKQGAKLEALVVDLTRQVAELDPRAAVATGVEPLVAPAVYCEGGVL